MTVTFLDIPELFGLSLEVYIICIIIALVTFFISKRLLKRFIRTDSTRNLATWTLTIIATPLIYLALIRLLMVWITYTPSQDFNKSQWLTDKEGRFQMAGDIISSKMLIGKDTNQVKQMLGEPTWGSGSTWRPDTINTWGYNMGMGGGGLGFMLHNLIIKFDKEKVVAVEHAIIRD